MEPDDERGEPHEVRSEQCGDRGVGRRAQPGRDGGARHPDELLDDEKAAVVAGPLHREEQHRVELTTEEHRQRGGGEDEGRQAGRSEPVRAPDIRGDEEQHARAAARHHQNLCVAQQPFDGDGAAAAHLNGADAETELTEHRQQLDGAREHGVFPASGRTEQPRNDDGDGAGRCHADGLGEGGHQVVPGHISAGSGVGRSRRQT